MFFYIVSLGWAGISYAELDRWIRDNDCRSLHSRDKKALKAKRLMRGLEQDLTEYVSC
jgi:hypothetical protein